MLSFLVLVNLSQNLLVAAGLYVLLGVHAQLLVSLATELCLRESEKEKREEEKEIFKCFIETTGHYLVML